MPVLWAYQSGWREVQTPWVYQSGWHVPSTVWAYGYGSGGWGWYWVWPPEIVDPPDPGLPPGDYILAPSTETISNSPGGLSWARFDTSSFRGRITKVEAYVTWKSLGSMGSTIKGNGSGTTYTTFGSVFGDRYKSVAYNLGGTAVSEFNAASATGYTLDPTATPTPSSWIDYLDLRLTIS